ncbi:MAG: gamma-glutamyltransferase family protein, partial [Candidatus Elarobacter sp.]
DVLRRGGNAVDAAIAANAVLSVVYPPSCGLGGDAFWIVYDPRAQTTVSYNGSGRTPRAASLDRLPNATLPERGALSVTVPGAVRSWEDVADAHGTRGLDELLAPAEEYARRGFAVTDVLSAYCAIGEPLLRAETFTERIFLAGGVPQPGDILRNPDLAESIAAIRRGGAGAFYTGAIAQRIVDTLNQRGNLMTLEDLAAHRTERTTPVRLAWNGGELLAHGLNSQGSTLLYAVGLLAGDRAADAPLWNHLAIEAMKSALALRDARFGDPDFGARGLEDELDPARLRAIRAALDPERASARTSAADRGDTIYLCVADERGMAVSLVQSLYMGFGSGIVADGTGITLHNRGACFSTQAGHPNLYDGAKRPMHTLSPAMFLRNGKPEIVFGTMGGDGQPQIELQFLHQLVERGLDVQCALDAPRWIYGRPTVPGRPEIAAADTVVVESRLDGAIVDGLERRGHRIATIGPYEHLMGHAHAIVIDRKRGTLAGGADPRADSAALGV